MVRAFPGVVLLGLLTACGRPDLPHDPLPEPVTAAAPVGVPSGQPRFFYDGERLGLSWVDREGDEAVLRFALHDGNGWGPAREVARGSDWFVNWADTPGVVALGGHAYGAFYLQRTGEGAYDYAIRVVRSDDGGATWGPPVTPHREDVLAEFGFVSALPEDGGLRIVWLDGEASASDGHHDAGAHEHHGAMALRTAVVGPGGAIAGRALLDERTCECCPTAMARTPGGLVVAYRGRSVDEIRDIAVVRQKGGAWTAPAVPHVDGWRIEGCPVNGPALAADGARVALAWYTGVGAGAVRLALSRDGGRTFGPAVRLDRGRYPSRPRGRDLG